MFEFRVPFTTVPNIRVSRINGVGVTLVLGLLGLPLLLRLGLVGLALWLCQG